MDREQMKEVADVSWGHELNAMCPHCGWRFDLRRGPLVPDHAYPTTPVGGRLCPGSQQGPRNPLSDRRPLWKDLTPEKEEAMKFQEPAAPQQPVPVCPECGKTIRNHPGCEPCATRKQVRLILVTLKKAVPMPVSLLDAIRLGGIERISALPTRTIDPGLLEDHEP